MCLHHLGLLPRLEIGLGVVLLLALTSVETSSVLPSTVGACPETWAASLDSFANAGAGVVVAGRYAAVGERGSREMK